MQAPQQPGSQRRRAALRRTELRSGALASAFFLVVSLQACGVSETAWREAAEKQRLAREAKPKEAQGAQETQKKNAPPTLPKLPDLVDHNPATKAASVPATEKAAGDGAAGKRPDPLAQREGDLGGEPESTEQRRRVSRDAILGVWTVTRIVRPQRLGGRVHGWMTFTRAFMSMHLYLAGPNDASQPRLQSAMRSYRIEGQHLVTQSMMGFRNGPRRARSFSSAAASKSVVESPSSAPDYCASITALAPSSS